VGLNLEGRNCIVTGASTGIGLAIAIELVREGANVALAARTAGPLEEAAELARSSGSGNAMAVPADTSDPEAVNRLVAATAEQFGAVDVLVNNAATGGGRARPAEATAVDLAAVAEDFAEKVLGYLRCAQAVAPYMIAQRFGALSMSPEPQPEPLALFHPRFGRPRFQHCLRTSPTSWDLTALPRQLCIRAQLERHASTKGYEPTMPCAHTLKEPHRSGGSSSPRRSDGL
jgi:NAD(P)-dependent dehydrogenase (short-subunit alcohol dehydrogenase family)